MSGEEGTATRTATVTDTVHLHRFIRVHNVDVGLGDENEDFAGKIKPHRDRCRNYTAEERGRKND